MSINTNSQLLLLPHSHPMHGHSDSPHKYSGVISHQTVVSSCLVQTRVLNHICNVVSAANSSIKMSHL